jgi:kumamolisin
VLRYPESQHERLEEERRRLLSGHAQKPLADATVRAADPSDIDTVRAFAEREGLTILETDPNARTVRLSGSVSTVNRLFGITLIRQSAHARSWTDYTGQVTIPGTLRPIVEAVLGLSQKPVASRVRG